MSTSASETEMPEFAVAVIGMAGRFPGADDVTSYFANLLAGREAVRPITAAEMDAGGIDAATRAHPGFVAACAPLDGAHDFDAEFFGISPVDARLMDPQHRVFLECAWQALESSGVLAPAARPSIGVIAGCSRESYSALLEHTGIEQGDRLAADLATNGDFLATRVSYLLDLRGPAYTVSSACSTSLVAIHLAVQSLLARECDVGVAGGAAIRHPLRRGHVHEVGGIYSSTGHCRPYDVDADGIASGDGVGVVVLKRLADAIRDGDPIHAIVRGSAVNNDGRDKNGFVAPGLAGQVDVVVSALQMADVDPRTIGFVEGHGTGTQLGDTIEVGALTRAWRSHTADRSYCVLGSVKSNIGHLDAAAGVAGFVKACLAVESGRIPGTLHWRAGNPSLALEDTPFVVTAATVAWPDIRGPRRAAVHSLGLGGTNAHVVLEQAPRRKTASETGLPCILPLSARSETALNELSTTLADAVETMSLDVRDVALTLQTGRSRYSYRRAVTSDSSGEAIAAWRAVHPPTRQVGRIPTLAFLFPGGGSHHQAMGRELYDSVPVFRASLDHAAAYLRRTHSLDLLTAMWLGQDASLDARVAFCSVVACSLGMVATLASVGARPGMVLGHSLGEISAAVAAGVFSAEDALDLCVARGELFRRLPPSGTMFVALDAQRVASILPAALTIAVINRDSCVVSGRDEDLVEFSTLMEDRQISHHRLSIGGAAHSSLLDPHLSVYRDALAKIRFELPACRFVSNLTGREVSARLLSTPEYWIRQVREPVLFDQCARTVATEDNVVVVDVGPGRSLASLLRAEVMPDGGEPIVNAMRHATEGRSETRVLANAIGKLWEFGVEVDWSGWPTGARSRVHLPVHPMRRHSFGPDPLGVRRSMPVARTNDARLWARGWRGRTATPSPVDARGRHATVVTSDPLLATPFVDELTARGVMAWVVSGEQPWEVDAERAAPDLVLDLRSFGSTGVNVAADILESAVACAHASGARKRFVVAGAGMFDVLGTDHLVPERAQVLGAMLVAAQECRALDISCVDIGDAVPSAGSAVVAQVIDELLTGSTQPLLAYRGARWWAPFVEPLAEAGRRYQPKHGGVYLITGGLGRFGRWVARCLARTPDVKLVLLQRTGLPPRDQWAMVSAADDETRRRVAAVQAMEASGARVEIVVADCADFGAVSAAVVDVERRHGPISGVVHASGDIRSSSSFSPLPKLRLEGMRRGLAMQRHAKVDGARTLCAVFRHRPLDFCLLFSSNASVLGGPGLALYAACNAHLDLLATKLRTRHGRPWTSISWDGWRLDEDEESGPRSSLDDFALTGEQAFDLMLRAIGTREGHVIASRGDFRARFDEWVSTVPATVEPPSVTTPSRSHADASPEQVIESIWRSMTGVTTIDPKDDLFNLGGNSLMLMRIRARLREHFDVDVPLRALMLNRTIEGMATLVTQGFPHAVSNARVASPAADADIMALLDRVAPQ